MKSIMPYINPGMKDRCIVCGAFAANYFASAISSIGTIRKIRAIGGFCRSSPILC